MKSSGSPCPLDQLSVISFKRSPYLRTYLTKLIGEIWQSRIVPTQWKRGSYQVDHKKGKVDDPSNFHPITLQSGPLKVFTSCLRNATYCFLIANKFIEQSIQTASHLTYLALQNTLRKWVILLIKRASNSAQMLPLYLILKMLLAKSTTTLSNPLDYHHIPDHIKSLYTDFQTAVITSEFHMSFIPVGRGVLYTRRLPQSAPLRHVLQYHYPTYQSRKVSSLWFLL